MKEANCNVREGTQWRAVGGMDGITVARSSMVGQRSDILLLFGREWGQG